MVNNGIEIIPKFPENGIYIYENDYIYLEKNKKIYFTLYLTKSDIVKFSHFQLYFYTEYYLVFKSSFQFFSPQYNTTKIRKVKYLPFNNNNDNNNN